MTAANEAKAATTITLSTGVVLLVQRAPSWAIVEVRRQMAREAPQPPVLHNPDKGRDEPNEADPAYLAALEAHAIRTAERLYDVAIALAMRVVSRPEDVPAPESEAWRESLAWLGIPLSDGADPRRRFAEWIKYVAAPDEREWTVLMMPLLNAVGTLEEDVAAATAAFRRDGQRGAGGGADAGERDPDGDRVRAAAAGTGA